ncbi:zinc finger CCCH-type with G patch domain-containing protein-like [Anneissia japonica]|uniref:zinc finger CCCH-type with G patch domain-containing protein-like n=1 Tax=Anneissia japonica TaxID=1529436 RepID=UPI001425A485|nr:zinc finger CCCH-type with G patch domain-containing protein-like [Anneissia japonica]
MDEETLARSIDLYKSQLSQVEAALTNGLDGDKSDLLQLQSDLQEVIKLTEESLLSLKKSKLLNFLDEVSGEQSSKNEDNLDAELEAFRECLSADVTNVDDTPKENDTEENEEEVEDELCGTQCRLLYSQEWGASQYHNAIVLNTENTDDNQEVKVRVLFCNPTHISMVPCPYFLEGKCKFSETDCRYSHGHIANVTELESFKEPDFSNLKAGCKCLARYDDSVWHRATVEAIDLEKHQITVQYENYDETATLNLESILPIEDIDSSLSDSEDDAAVSLPASSSSTPEHLGSESPVLLWQPGSSSAIGEWERYTSGIGSKLMLKMGYEYGKGLGKNGEGRVEPVEAVIVPQGKSLDHCMELKEKKKLKIVGKKKQKGFFMAGNQARKKKENVFDFINSRLGTRKSKVNEFLKKTGLPKKGDGAGGSSEGQSSLIAGRGLNIKLVQTQEEIRKVEKHLAHKKHSLQRNSRDKATAVHMQEKINEMENYLLRLKSSESVLQKNQNSRNQHKKLTIF